MNVLPISGRRGCGPARAIPIALAVLITAAPAHALVITPTFDTSITTQANATAIEGAIKSAITMLEANITNPTTVSIDFQAMNSGLGQSETSVFEVNYNDYYNALKANAKSVAPITALASLGAPPTSATSGNPVNGNTQILITSANGRALGFNTPGGVAGTFDSVISLNTSITSPPNAPGGSTFGLQAVVLHEVDEALGIGGTGSTLTGSGPLTGPVGGLDLYRYSAAGVRSYSNTQTTTPLAYFSINGGATVLSYFNQTSGADFGDWLSNPIPAGFQAQVQDAFAVRGKNPTLGPNELAALSVIGYNLAVPEPSSGVLTGIGATALAALGCRRRRDSGDAEAVLRADPS